MKKILINLVLVFIIIFTFSCQYGQNEAIVGKEDMKPRLIESTNYSSNVDVVKNVSPAVVGIYSQDNASSSIGTGVAIQSGGYVLTNSHVVTNTYVTLYLASGDTTKAKLVYRDESLDLAIVKSEVDLPYLSVASSGDYFVGEDVLAIGTPLALQFKHTVTKGIISAKNRTIKVDSTSGVTLYNLIQHDASINPGNSGGPLINLRGEVIGINTVKVEDAEGLGFAIPTDTISPIFSKLSADGEYKPAYLGLFGVDAKYQSNIIGAKGVYVYDIQSGSSLDLVGLKKGDIITRFDGKEIDDMLTLRKIMYSKNLGDKVKINYLSDNFENEITITLKAKQN